MICGQTSLSYRHRDTSAHESLKDLKNHLYHCDSGQRQKIFILPKNILLWMAKEDADYFVRMSTETQMDPHLICLYLAEAKSYGIYYKKKVIILIVKNGARENSSRYFSRKDQKVIKCLLKKILLLMRKQLNLQMRSDVSYKESSSMDWTTARWWCE